MKEMISINKTSIHQSLAMLNIATLIRHNAAGNRQLVRQEPSCTSGRAPRVHNAFVLLVASVACAGMSSNATAQTNNLGSYSGKFEVSGTQFGPEVTYRASIKVSLPVSERSGSSITAEFLSGEAPDATVLISQWDVSFTEKFADSGGQFNSYSCTLANPAEIPMSATGVLDVNLKDMNYALSLTLLSTKDLEFNCKHSRSGPYTKRMGVALTLGTGSPGMHYENPLPFTEVSHLTAKYTLQPTAQTKGQYGPIVQEWDLKLN